MSRSIKGEVEYEFIPTPAALAEVFRSMYSDEQAAFFNRLGTIAGSDLAFQLQAVANEESLEWEGRCAMGMIGDYSKEGVIIKSTLTNP